jgi:hypothetical protein
VEEPSTASIAVIDCSKASSFLGEKFILPGARLLPEERVAMRKAAKLPDNITMQRSDAKVLVQRLSFWAEALI